jgi:MerR family transcriptional regulator, thiopeptide resistance regulator
MPLIVGQLARRCGLTARTLHPRRRHRPAQAPLRSDGYRLYDRANVERLHRFQALRQLGLSLADRQIAQLDQEPAQAARLREHLALLRNQLAAGQSPPWPTGRIRWN